MKTRRLFTILFLVMFFSACGSQAAPSAVPTLSQSATPVQGTSTSVPTMTPSAIPTPSRPSILAPRVPAVSAPISVENIGQLTRLTSLGVGDIWGINLSPEGKYLEVDSSTGVQIYDASNLKPVAFLPTAIYHYYHYNTTFLDGDTKISASNSYQGYIWSLPDGKEIRHVYFLHSDAQKSPYVPTYQSIPDAAWQKVFVYAVPFQKTGLYQVDTGEAIYTLDYNAAQAVISPDDRLVALNTGDKLVIVNYEDGEVLQEIPETGIKSLFFFPDSKMLASIYDNQVKFWNMTDFTLIDTISGAGSGIEYEFSPDKSVFVLHTNKAFRFYRTSDRVLLNGIGGNGIKFTADSQGVFVDNGSGQIAYYVFNEDRSKMTLSSSLAGKGFASLQNFSSRLAVWNSVAVSTDNNDILTIRSTGDPHGDYIKSLLVLDVPSGALTSVDVGDRGTNGFWGMSAIWLPEMNTFVMLMETPEGIHELYLLDQEAKSLTPIITAAPYRWDLAISFSPDSDLVAFARGNQLVSWDIKNGGYWPIEFTPSELVDSYNFDTTIHFSEDGKLMTLSDAIDVNRVFSTADYSMVSQSKEGGVWYGTKNETSPDGRYSAWTSGSYQNFSVTVVENGNGNAAIDLASGQEVDFAFSPDSRMIAVSTSTEQSSEVTLYDLSTGQPIFTDVGYYIQGTYAPKVAFSPDGNYLAIMTEMGYPQIWGIP